MADLLLPAPSAPSIRLKSILHPAPSQSIETKTASLRHAKSTPQLPGNSANAISRTVRGFEDLWWSWRDGSTREERQERALREERRQILCLRMKTAETYDQWESSAKELDHIEGNDFWKEDDLQPTEYYNPDLLIERLRALDEARTRNDLPLMMHLIRTALSRDLGGLDDVDLYRHSYIGTKRLIERYVESTIETIDAVVTRSAFDQTVEHRDLLEGMLYARQSFGRSALLLSGGGTFGMSHIGVLKSLFEAELLPRIISGASAGSIVCSVMCTRTDEELPDLLRQFPYGDLAVFEDEENRDGMLGHLRRLLTEGSWSDIKHLTRVMRDLTGDMTFQEAYNRTRRILNICVSTASVYELPRLLNYVTAPNVMIWSAVAASCSLPLVFTASPLLVKDPLTGEHSPWNPTPLHCIDGSVDNDLPMTRLSEMFNVNHFIVSQVNPHVVPFLTKDDYLSPDPAGDRPKPARQDDTNWAYTLTTLAKDEALHRLQFLAEMGILPNLATKLKSVLSQKYSGDITILPEMSLNDLPSLLSNPTTDFMLRTCLAGERATWPKLSRIRDRCATELALDRAVHRLRARVVFAESHPNTKAYHHSIGNLHNLAKAANQASVPKGNTRPRRQSGGSVLTPTDRRALLDNGVKDSQNGVVGANSSSQASHLATPTLTRASKSHIQMPRYREQLTSPNLDGGADARPRTLAPSPSIKKHYSPRASMDSKLQPGSNPSTRTVAWPATKVSKVFLASAQEDADTTESSPSSDAEPLELATDESSELDGLGQEPVQIASKRRTSMRVMRTMSQM